MWFIMTHLMIKTDNEINRQALGSLRRLNMSGRLEYRLCMLMHALLSIILGPRRAVVRLTRRRVYR